jgi:hypothetical protein
VSLPGGLLFSLAPFTFASLTVASGFAPFLRGCLRSGTQFADRT